MKTPLWKFILIGAIIIIIILFCCNSCSGDRKLHKPYRRPKGERGKAPVPIIITNDINVVNSPPGIDTTIIFEWSCDFSKESTIYKPRLISFQLEIYDSNENILPKATGYYNYEDSLNYVDGDTVYYKVTESSDSGYLPGRYTLKLTSFVMRVPEKMKKKTSQSSQGVLNIEACKPSCDGIPQGGSDGCGGVCDSLGCWDESPSGILAMPHALIISCSSGQPTLSDCKEEAKNGKFKYFGLQDYNDPSCGKPYGACWATNDPGTIGTKQQPGEQGYQMYGQVPSLIEEPEWSGGDEGCYMKDVEGENTYVGSKSVNAVYSTDD